MAKAAARQYDPEKFGEVGGSVMLVVSIAAHLFVLVALPFLLVFFGKPKKYDRPQTFTLVSAPIPPSAPPPPQRAPVEPAPPTPTPPAPTPAPAPTPTPAPTPKPPEPKPEPKPEVQQDPKPAPKEQPVTKPKPVKEDLSELASLFSTLPAPAQVSAVGVQSHPYLTAVQNKIQSNWHPPTENRNLSVVVKFIILRDGTTTDITIANSSGDATLDGLARRAVTISSPFGRIPPTLGGAGDKLEISVTLRPTRRST